MSFPRRGLVALVCLGACLVAPPAHAWGPDGHRIVCEIAWQAAQADTRRALARWLRVPPNARKQLGLERTELGTPARRFSDACIWPDTVRQPRDDDYWNDDDIRHYVNAQGTGKALDAPDAATELVLPDDCGPRCVTEAIGTYTQLLLGTHTDPARPVWAAARFLGHFVGDVHQPLHASYAGDRGGNDLKVTIGGQPCREHPADQCTDDLYDRNNLHGVWDYTFVAAELEGRDVDWRTYARQLLDDTPAFVREDTALDWNAWAEESFHLSRNLVYRLPEDGEVLGGVYEIEARDLVRQRLTLAGWRLARLLDAIVHQDPALTTPR